MFHRLISLLCLFIICLNSRAQISPVPGGNRIADPVLNRIQMDAAYAPFFNGHDRGFSSRGARSGTAARRQQAPAQRVNSLSDFIQRTNSICYDTSSRFFLDNDSLIFYVQHPVRARDGNLFICGQYTNYTDGNGGGFVMKCDNNGNLIWDRLYDSADAVNMHYFNFHHTLELQDGSILLAGYTNNEVNGNDDLVLIRTNANGAVIWNKRFYSRFWTNGNGSADYFYFQEVKQDPFTGDIYFIGPHWTDGKALVKVDLNTGNILWSNAYPWSNLGHTSFDWPFGIDIRANEIRYWGRNYTNLYTYITVIRVNKQTGDTISTRIFNCTDTNYYRLEFLVPDKMTVLNNGHTLLSGGVYGSFIYNWDGVYPLFQGAIAEFDDNLNFVKATVYRSPVESNIYNTRVTVFPDGSGTLSYLTVYSGYSGTGYFSQLQDGQIIKRRVQTFNNNGYPFETTPLKLPDGGDISVRMMGDSVNNNARIEFLKRHASDTASACLGFDDTLTFAEPVHYAPLHVGLGIIPRDVFLEHPAKILRMTSYASTLAPGCFQVSHCDTIWLSASPTVACPGMPVTVRIHKNSACGTEVPLQYDTAGVASVVRVNDSTYTFTFNTTWTNYIKASLQGCTLHRDSVQLNILAAPPGLNLGPDTVICPSNTIVLRAGRGFATYLWQDGSTDSLFTVTQPGQYYVTVTNACGGSFSDTVNVAPHPPIPFSIGPDRTKCNNDTIQLNATAGFLNYSWSPAYNISSTTTQNVVVNPSIDTVYRVRAEKTPGCFAYDTVRITVYQSPPVNLGADRSICTGDSLLLDAGPGFVQYNWNTGPTTQQLIVKTAGQYQLTATTSQGCISRDTFRLISVYALPVVTLNPDTSLCIGSSRVLDAGAGYISYAWNTGAGTRTISVNGTGIYGVNVIDPNGCKGSDTTIINKLLPLPAGFLFADTAICSFGSIELTANSSFSRYNWSTGSTSSVISITQPGTYWLDATDRSNCTGRDSVIVNPKQCLTGLYVPSGFTPNGDGKNDLLKPFLFGNIKQYEFRVFNRWGETVFVTKDPTAGWNGTWKGIVQDGNVFIWTCRYQLEGEEVKTSRGTVVLIR